MLQELIYRVRAGDLRADIACVVSNHRDLEPVVRGAGIPFHHIPVTPETKAEAEAAKRASRGYHASEHINNYYRTTKV